jgi:hypothetical protein
MIKQVPKTLVFVELSKIEQTPVVLQAGPGAASVDA